MVAYAQGTAVPTERSRAELERLLRRFGATEFAYGWGPDAERIGFAVHGVRVQMTLLLPNAEDPLFALTPGGKRRSGAAQAEAHAAEVRRRWRSLLLVCKAKLTGVADGITTVEREFLADVVVPEGSGMTVTEYLADQGRLPSGVRRALG